MPRKRRRHCGPQRRHASRTTSVSEVVENVAPPETNFGPDLPEVVKLAVVTEDQGAFYQRLLTMLEIDDRKATVGEVDVDPLVRVRERTRFVRASVIETAAHPLRGQASVNLLIRAGNATHGSGPRSH